MATHTEPCPQCRAEGHDSKGDNATVYEDGGVYCHARHGVLVRSDGGVPDKPPADSDFKHGTYRDLPHRRIREDTCKKYRYQVTDSGTEIGTLFKKGKVHAQQLRAANTKAFISIGQTSTGEFFGQHTCRGAGGKWLVVTEGYIDCMSVAQHGPWDVVSLTNGVQSAAANFKNNLEFVNGYETVFLCFDNDEAGELAVDAVKDLVRPGKVKITSLRLKDANEYLTKGSVKDLVSDIWASATYAPPGIVASSEVDLVTNSHEVLTYPDSVLNSVMLGREVNTSTLIGSGTGSGKSTKLKEFVDHDLNRGVKVGALFFEESPWDTVMDIASLRLGKPIRRILRQRKAKALDPNMKERFKDDLDDDQIAREFGRVKTQPLYLWNPDDPPTADAVLARMEYLVLGLGCKAIYLDHISLMQFGGKSELEGLDDFAVRFKSLVLRCPAHFFVVSQLSQGDASKSHEEGGKITLRHFRGSQRVISVFNEVMALQRNQQGDTEEARNTTNLFCLKARLGGETGHVNSYRYDQQTGRMTPAAKSPMDALQDTATPQHDFNMNQL